MVKKNIPNPLFGFGSSLESPIHSTPPTQHRMNTQTPGQAEEWSRGDARLVRQTIENTAVTQPCNASSRALLACRGRWGCVGLPPP